MPATAYINPLHFVRVQRQTDNRNLCAITRLLNILKNMRNVGSSGYIDTKDT